MSLNPKPLNPKPLYMADVNWRNSDWRLATPLHKAAQSGNSKVVETLLNLGADPNKVQPETLTKP
jgi:ankyrin repeat protein